MRRTITSMIVLSTMLCSSGCTTISRTLNHRLSSNKDSSIGLGFHSVDWAASRLGLDPARNKFHAPIVYHEDYSIDWPERHTFPMSKFERTAHALLTTCQRTHPKSPLPRPLVRDPDHFFLPLDKIPIDTWIEPIIDKDYVRRFLGSQLSSEECRRIGFRELTLRPDLIRRTLLEIAGTVLTCQLASVYGIAANVAGGTHHAHPQGGAGYTILNDLAIATHVLTHQLIFVPKLIERVLVIDCDVHQGDGTAQFPFDQLFTLSLHCASNYPHPKANSTYDVSLSDHLNDDAYLECLQESVTRALDEVKPDLVLYNAGVDIYENDQLGRLDITEDGIRQRDRYVLDLCVSRHTPVAAVVGGGYDNDVDALGRRHAIVHEECAYVWRKYHMWELCP